MLEVNQHMQPITGIKGKTKRFASPKEVGALNKNPNKGPKGKDPRGGSFRDQKGHHS